MLNPLNLPGLVQSPKRGRDEGEHNEDLNDLMNQLLGPVPEAESSPKRNKEHAATNEEAQWDFGGDGLYLLNGLDDIFGADGTDGTMTLPEGHDVFDLPPQQGDVDALNNAQEAEQCDCMNLRFDEEMGTAICTGCEKVPFSMDFQTAPPKHTVYRKFLNPHPTLIVRCTEEPRKYPFGHLVVKAALVNTRTNEIDDEFLSGKAEESQGYSRSDKSSFSFKFKKLKITQTTLQNEGQNWRIQFTLYAERGDERMPLCSVLSHAINVVSHKDLLAKSAGNKVPRVTRVVPSTIPVEGGEFVILGANFIDTKYLKVRVGETTLDKVPRRSDPNTVGVTFDRQGVLIVKMPTLDSANDGDRLDIVISNDGEKWSQVNQHSTITVCKPRPVAVQQDAERVIDAGKVNSKRLLEDFTFMAKEIVDKYFQEHAPQAEEQQAEAAERPQKSDKL
jgi:hypothetical protein